ncbi:hypothetical protein DQ04_05341030 [Trypanosoma grayi]|uniref:hypothetical protein n=1 Tax=Trypanosoma grayi TaxID=71804 RepID=UPI0004F4A58C|nr:hypothetical protein DQ04_05341030 [Trypanosoma grayi]KEG09367.1 hypothetical protein DQ04_05341030 [Trypanosoma grayi]
MGKVPERRDCRENTRYQSISFTVEYPVSQTGKSNAIRYSSPGNCVMVRIERDPPSRDQAEGPTGDCSSGTPRCWCRPPPWVERSPLSGGFSGYGWVSPPPSPT